MNVNYYLTKQDVFNPLVNYLPQKDELTFWQNVKSAYSRYCYKFIQQARTRLNLTNIIDTDSFVIKKDLLNRIAEFNFKDIISEVYYTLKLANEKVPVALIVIVIITLVFFIGLNKNSRKNSVIK